MRKRNKQRGSALISALLLMSIVTLLAVGMLTRQDIQIRRTESLFQQERLLAQAAWVELWGIQVLNTTVKQLTPENDYISLDQAWALPLEEFQREGLWVSGEVTDLQSRFNINNVVVSSEEAAEQEENDQENGANPNEQNNTQPLSPKERQEQEQGKEPEKIMTPADFLTDENNYTAAWVFTRLTENQAKLNAIEARSLSESLLSWIMPDETEMDNYYLKLREPYRAAHQPLWSISELRLVQGMTNDIYNAIQPYVMALSTTSTPSTSTSTQNANEPTTESATTAELIPVNVNTASAELLAAILAVEPSQINNLISLRPYFTQESLQEQLSKVLNSEEKGNPQSLLSITSDYFVVRALVRDERRKLVLYSILHRDEQGKVVVMGRIQGEM